LGPNWRRMRTNKRRVSPERLHKDAGVEWASRGRDMKQAIQDQIFPSVRPSAGAGEIWNPASVSSLLFIGSPEQASQLDAMDGIRMSVVTSVMAAGHLRAMPVVDIVWLAAAEAAGAEDIVGIFDAAAAKRCGLVCEASLAALDRLAACVPEGIRIEWLVDADPTDRRIALAAARHDHYPAVHEITRDPAMERIDRLQEEVARISRLLGDLAAQRSGLPGTPVSYGSAGEDYDDYAGQLRAPPRDFSSMPRSFVPEERTIERQRAKAVRKMLRQRRMREQYFPADLFADPAWDMLLDLYAARLERQPVSVSSLCIAAAVPATTALRWIKTMTDVGLFVREADPQDGRRIFIALAEGAFDAVARYFEALDE